MYLNPPFATLKELQDAIASGVTIRVYKRPVPLKTRDKSYMDYRRSHIVLDGLEVYVMAFKGKVVAATLANGMSEEEWNNLPEITESVKQEDPMETFVKKFLTTQKENPNEA